MRSIFLWILLLLIIIYITNSKIYEGYTYTKYEYIDYPGNNIGQKNSPITKGHCERLCNDLKGSCKGYVIDFVFGSGPGSCWLKSKMQNVNSTDNTGITDSTKFSYIKN